MIFFVVASLAWGAGLLFLVQPMVARMALPTFGGSPWVWNVCLVFFQLIVLLGYLSAHWLGRLGGGVSRWTLVALLLLGVVMLPFQPATLEEHTGNEVLALLEWLFATLGLPAVALGITGSLVQKWFSESGHRRAGDPYFLYAWSNAGSLAGLLAYPALIEPFAGLHVQRWAWTAGYGALALLVSAAAWTTARCGERVNVHTVAGERSSAVLSLRTALLCMTLAAVPSALLVGVTSHVTTGVAALPLLWVLPLALYLVAYAIAFVPRLVVEPRKLAVALTVGVILVAASSPMRLRHPVSLIIGLHCAAFFVAAWVCHTRLARLRPAPEQLTTFYLLAAIGGVLGGAVTALGAPLVFERPIEYPLLLGAAVLLQPWPRVRAVQAMASPSLARFLVPALSLIAVGLLASSVAKDSHDAGELLHSERTFFGLHHVRETAAGESHLLFHGTTLHGLQFTAESARHEPLGYFHRKGPIGKVFSACHDDQRLDHVLVIGLGTGALAAYGKPGRHFTFIEIDREVAAIAENPRLFTYLSDSASRSDLRIVIGDGRQMLAREPDASLGLIVVDAFASDAIPVHLLTREALALELEKLAPGGLMVFHISNNFFDFRPPLAATAASLGLVTVVQRDEVTDSAALAEGRRTSVWLVAARSAKDLQKLDHSTGFVPLLPAAGDQPWTDDWSNLLGALVR